MSLKQINVVAPWNDKEGWYSLMNCIASGFIAEQTKVEMEKQGYYVPEDMIKLMDNLFDISMSMEIGARQYESALYETNRKEEL